MSRGRFPAKSYKLFICLALVFALAMVQGCGITTVASDTVNYVQETFASKGDSLRKRMVVLPFKSGVKGLEPKAKEIRDQLIEKMAKWEGVSLIDSSRLIDEMALVPSQVTDEQQRLVLAARKLGLNVVFRATITDLSVSYRLTGIYGMRENTPFLEMEVDLGLVDVISGAYFDVESIRSSLELENEIAQGIALGKKPGPKKVDKLAKELVEPCVDWLEDMLESHKWSGMVLAVDQDRLLVTVSKDTGLNVGDILTVQAIGEKIKAGSGRFFHVPGEVIGKVRLEELGKESSWARIIPPEEPEPQAPEKLVGEKLENEKMGKEDLPDQKPQPKPKPKPVFTPGQVVRPL